MNTTPIYLDHAATTPPDPIVVAAMQPYLGEQFANPSSLYGLARASRGAVEEARHTISAVLGGRPTEIVFTSGGTEGDNLAIQGVLKAHPGAHWITTAIEHDAVLGCVEGLKPDGHAATVVSVSESGIVDIKSLEAAITDDTVLISLMLANNEIGTIQPVAGAAKLVAAVRAKRLSRGLSRPLYLHSDAVQAANYLDLHVSRLGIDLLTIGGSKIYGPKGTGALYVRHGTVLAPLMYGGGQERGRRSGTENVAGIVGLAVALSLAAHLRDAESHRLTVLRNELAHELLQRIDGAVINGHSSHRLPNNLSLSIPGAEGEAMVLYLDNAGIMASTGSACSTGSLDPSHVLLAIGRTAGDAGCSLRLTLGRSTSKADISRLVEALPPIVLRLREL
jgi:cysteine desulfurase